MMVAVEVALAALALSPLGWGLWLRNTRQKPKLPVALMCAAPTLIACWFGIFGLYLFSTEDNGAGHPHLSAATFAVLGVAALLYIFGNTLKWRATHSARRRNTTLGLTPGRRWWPGWLVGVGTLAIAPLAVFAVGAAIVWDLDTHAALTQHQVNVYIFTAVGIAAAVHIIGGWIYFMLIRPRLQHAESERLKRANRAYLNTPPHADNRR